MCAQQRNVHIKVSNTESDFTRSTLLVLIVSDAKHTQTNSCLLAFLQHACCCALLQYVSCIIPCNTTPCGMRTSLWKACRFRKCPSRVVCIHHVCCLPDTIPVCVSSSPVSTADCWKMHVMCQMTLQSSLSLFELSASRQSSVV